MQMRLGMFDEPDSTPWSTLGVEDVASKEHLTLSLDAAHQGIVLLKNNKNTLPLDNTTIKSMANVGPNAMNLEEMKANYAGNPPFIYCMQEGLYQHVDSVQWEEGVKIDSNDTSGITKAVDAAKKADAVVIGVGLDQTQVYLH